MAKLMSKSQLIEKIADQHPNNMTRKDVRSVMESLVEIGHKELKKTGAFFVPGFAKFVVIKKPATKERKGINPFTKEPTIFKAKPARKIIRARPVKAAKDAVA
jgi:DNA-binding protein HU-beta